MNQADDWQDVTLGTANGQDVKLSSEERTKGTVLLGATGTGKTSLLEHLAIADLQANTTSIIFDPHGEISERLLRIGAGIAEDRILFCEITGNLSYGFNPLQVNDPNDPLEVSRTVDSLLQVFRKHWSSNTAYAFGSRVEWVLGNTFRTIIANTPNYTLAEIPLLLRDRDFRQKLVAKVQNPQVQEFWGRYKQLESTQRPRDQWELIESTITRLSQFLANEWLYRVLYQAKGTINFSRLIDSGKTILFSLPIGKLGEEPASLLGSLLLGKLVTTILGRLEYGTIPPRLNIYIDEYSRFSIPVFADLWTQARKFNCALTATIQTLSQIPDDENKAALLQAGNHLCFRLIGSDAKTLAAQMPLPDPASLMKPEPILVYSPQAVNDIWHRGHPNQIVALIRKDYFWVVDAVERMGNEDWLEYDFNTLFQEFPEWIEPEPTLYSLPPQSEHLFPDLHNYRSHKKLMQLAIQELNDYYLAWMNHEFVLQPDTVDTGQFNYLCTVIVYLMGILGIRPYVTQVKQKEWEEYFEQRRALRLVTSPREKEQLQQWAMIRLEDGESEAIENVIKLVLLMISKGHVFEPLLNSVIVSTFISIRKKAISKLFDRGPDLPIFVPETPRRTQAITKRAEWEASNLWNTVTVLAIGGGLLEKEPLYVQSHTYKDVEVYRRTYSDVRDELTTKIVSLPPYQAICSLVSHAGELPVQIKTLPPLQIAPTSEEGARAIRERSRKELGHPWQEVYKDMQTRQSLPPAKPHM